MGQARDPHLEGELHGSNSSCGSQMLRESSMRSLSISHCPSLKGISHCPSLKGTVPLTYALHIPELHCAVLGGSEWQDDEIAFQKKQK
jgi:hypothetical protein